ncbi:class I SAM-dependent methyltransferase [Arvimicrobium flavum]|uniref:class I SAM-dependent methyltransferase n=1 Tax=Arvimicrobium flavum TaxID=3393320 RepID=UPI00237AA3F9|nr:methyltransferase [Mesorhizobium shangrilense]
MNRLQPAEAERFILANTSLTAPPHVPEVRLHLADEAHELWQRTEEELAEIGLPPPFWAFAWAGGQGLARYLLDRPDSVRGKTALDFATGSGLVGIAAAMAGAASVTAADIDPFCEAAIRLNAAANCVTLQPMIADLVDTDAGWDVLLAGDIFYQRDIVDRLVPWFTRLRQRGCEIIVGDPGRAYLPKDRLEQLAEYRVPVTRALEDAEVKRTVVWRFL